MKKNTMMRIASALAIAVLLTTCTISGTFAKYVTTATAEATAQVAKFGIILTVEADTFADSYDTADDTATVIASGDYELVAPGTKNLGTTKFKINGSAEVAVKVEMSLGTTEDVFLAAADEKYYDFTTADAEDTFDLDEDYYPVVFTLTHTYGTGAYSIAPAVDGTDATVDTTTEGTDVVTGTLAQIEAVLANLTTSMEHVNPNYTFDDTFELTWEWIFEDNDAADTVLGNLAAGETVADSALADGTDYNLGVSYDFTITVTQID